MIARDCRDIPFPNSVDYSDMYDPTLNFDNGHDFLLSVCYGVILCYHVRSIASYIYLVVWAPKHSI